MLFEELTTFYGSGLPHREFVGRFYDLNKWRAYL
jgi:hypothetical protein